MWKWLKRKTEPEKIHIILEVRFPNWIYLKINNEGSASIPSERRHEEAAVTKPIEMEIPLDSLQGLNVRFGKEV